MATRPIKSGVYTSAKLYRERSWWSIKNHRWTWIPFYRCDLEWRAIPGIHVGSGVGIPSGGRGCDQRKEGRVLFFQQKHQIQCQASDYCFALGSGNLGLRSREFLSDDLIIIIRPYYRPLNSEAFSFSVSGLRSQVHDPRALCMPSLQFFILDCFLILESQSSRAPDALSSSLPNCTCLSQRFIAF